MKFKLRFVGYFTLGLFLYLFYMAALVIVVMEGLLAPLHLSDAFMSAGVWAAMMFSALSGGAMLSAAFIRPIALILRMIRSFSTGNYDLSELEHKAYSPKGKLRFFYRLYREVLDDLSLLADTLQKNQQQRRQLEKAKRSWISGVSHDLKTPLSYIMGYSALLLDDTHSWDEAERHKFLREIHTKGQYIEGLIGDLNLTFRINDGDSPMTLNKKSIPLVPFLQGLLADVINDPRAEGYALTLDALEGDAAVQGDEKLLYRALLNLMMNGILHNPKGTTLTTTLCLAQSTAVVKIADDGVGMSEATLNRLFTRYAGQGGASTAANGLGLSVAKQIVLAHGGDIAVSSALGKGSCFAVSLPL